MRVSNEMETDISRLLSQRSFTAFRDLSSPRSLRHLSPNKLSLSTSKDIYTKDQSKSSESGTSSVNILTIDARNSRTDDMYVSIEFLN